MRIKEALFGILVGNAIAGATRLVVSMHVADGLSIEIILISIIVFSIGIYTSKKKKINNKKVNLN